MTTIFQEKVYALLHKHVKKGKVTTYLALAKALNSSPRAVGQALKRNPYAPKIPCHRVINSNGTIGGFNGKTSGKNISKKIKLLKKEGIALHQGRVAKRNMLYKL